TGQLLRTISVAKAEKAEPWPQRLRNLSISADGQRIITVERGKATTEKGERRAFLAVTVWDAETGKQIHSGKMADRDALAVSTDGKRIAHAEGSGRLVIADITDSDSILYDLEGDSQIESSVIGICFSPDGKRIACSYRNGNIKV